MDNLNYFGQSGWVCPKCGRVFSPYTQMCTFCIPNKITTANTNESYSKLDTIGNLHYQPGVRSMNTNDK